MALEAALTRIKIEARATTRAKSGFQTIVRAASEPLFSSPLTWFGFEDRGSQSGFVGSVDTQDTRVWDDFIRYDSLLQRIAQGHQPSKQEEELMQRWACVVTNRKPHEK